jgi:VanZ family protein
LNIGDGSPSVSAPDAMGKNSGRKQLGWALLVAALIVVASSRSQVLSGGFEGSDKVVHFCIYGLLATLVCRAGRGWRAAAWALLATSAFGATDEWHQSFVPGRSCDVFDWLADTSGAALAVGLYAGWAAYRQLLERPVLLPASQAEAR